MIYYRNDVRASGVDARALKSAAARLLEVLGERTSSLSLTLVDDAAIRALNREHRGTDKPTDVLSFGLIGFEGAAPQASRPRLRGVPQPRRALDMGKQKSPRERAQIASRRAPMLTGTMPGETSKPERMLGDVVISVDTARRQAAQYDATLQSELYRLLIHGLLHVLGHDHEDATERARMEAEERRLADAIGMHWPYEVNA